MDNDPLKCKIIGFWASERPDLCEKFIKGHEKILIDHGLNSLISTDAYWTSRKDVFVLLAETKNESIGGIRLERKRKAELLPFEKSLLPFNSDITQLIDRLSFNDIYEACGLWNAKSAAGNDLGIFMCRVCVAMSPILNIDAIISLNGVYTYKIPKDMGSHIIREIGENGIFKYPIERFHSALWIQDDLIRLQNASKECKRRVKSLRKNINQTFLEKNEKDGILITYQMEIK